MPFHGRADTGRCMDREPGKKGARGVRDGFLESRGVIGRDAHARAKRDVSGALFAVNRFRQIGEVAAGGGLVCRHDGAENGHG
jgi:hypothetical protein